jgi:hypothetical protein
MVYFSAVGGDVVIDVIPIIEIAEVSEVFDEDENNERPTASRKERRDGRFEKVSKFANSLQIVTCPGGYNSGRTYVLQASSAELCATMIQDLTELSRISKKLALRRSKFQKTQARVKRVFLSNAFHILMSVMILVVCLKRLSDPSCPTFEIFLHLSNVCRIFWPTLLRHKSKF